MQRVLAVSSLLLALAASAIASEGDDPSRQPYGGPGYQFHAQGVTGGVRYGYANLYRAPLRTDARFANCTWEQVPTAFGARWRAKCE